MPLWKSILSYIARCIITCCDNPCVNNGKFIQYYNCHPKIILKELCCSKTDNNRVIRPGQLIEYVVFQQQVRGFPQNTCILVSNEIDDSNPCELLLCHV